LFGGLFGVKDRLFGVKDLNSLIPDFGHSGIKVSDTDLADTDLADTDLADTDLA